MTLSAERVTSAAEPGRRPPTRWSVIWLLVAATAFLGLRVVHAAQPAPVSTVISTDKVVVVGVAGRFAVTAGDRAVLQQHAGASQVGAVSVRPRLIGECAAAGWATLGAGRRTSVAGLCDPAVQQQRVTDWPQRLAAAAAGHGDARLGTLAAAVPHCVAAVGPGAALAAARPDGTLARYQTLQQFLGGGLATPCPLTLVDAGESSDRVVSSLAGRSDTTVLLTGIGPPPGSHDPALQLIYVVPAAPAGWLTSASTHRRGVVDLTDLTQSLIDVGRGTAPENLPVDGAPLQVRPAQVTPAEAQHQLEAVTALSTSVLRTDVALAVAGALLLALYLLAALTRRRRLARVVAAWSCIVPAAMMLTGALPWSASRSPALTLGLALAGWAVVLTVVTLAAARRLDLPVAVVGAGVTVAAFTADAALGGVMEPGSMLNSRPVNGGRWYGFGNVTFAAYAAATLLVAGYVAHRLRAAGRPRAAVVAAAAIGFGVVLCEGWPSMGADFGGVLALAPALTWLLLALSGLRVTWRHLVAAAAGAVVLVGTISWLDWRRGPTARSHLGAFVQRVLDGDAQDIVLRKAMAAGESVVTVAGLAALVLGVVAWVVLFRRVVPTLVDSFSTLRQTAVAALLAAVLGTVLNDGGITVWSTLTAAFTVSAGALVVDRYLPPGDRPRGAAGSAEAAARE